MNNKELLRMLCSISIKEIRYAKEIAKKNNLENEQFFLDYLDEINKMSVDLESDFRGDDSGNWC